MRPRGSVSSILVGMVSVALLAGSAGCSESTTADDVPTRSPATAAVSPATSASPAGQVLASGPVAALVSDPKTGVLGTLDGATVSLLDPSAPGSPARTVTLPGPAADLSVGVPGEFLAATAHGVARIDVAAATVREIPVEGEPRSVLARQDGSLVVGTADGTLRELSADGAVVTRTVRGLVSADALAMVGDKVTALDRPQTSITELDPGEDRLGLALRAGDGATKMLADTRGRVVVTDSEGGQLLVYGVGPLVLHQRFPVRSSPYALAYDQRSDLIWVTCTQSNEVVGFDLSTGIPKEQGRYPTVRQPNSVTVDQRTGDLFVGSATGDGVQRIGADDRKRGH
ncbi:YncE family protein [Nocardia callitridis]